MQRAAVEALVGLPSFDQPDNPWEPDSVSYEVEGGRYVITYVDGKVSKIRFAKRQAVTDEG